jgi:hypothetical protein
MPTVAGESHTSGVKPPEREAEHSPSSSAEVKNVLSLPFTPLYTFISFECTDCVLASYLMILSVALAA